VLPEILEGTWEATPESGSAFAPGFRRLGRQVHCDRGHSREGGLYQGIEFVRNGEKRNQRDLSSNSRPGLASDGERCKMAVCRFDQHWLAFGPPFISNERQIGRWVGILDRRSVRSGKLI